VAEVVAEEEDEMATPNGNGVGAGSATLLEDTEEDAITDIIDEADDATEDTETDDAAREEVKAADVAALLAADERIVQTLGAPTQM
jgi:hypothetical protein